MYLAVAPYRTLGTPAPRAGRLGTPLAVALLRPTLGTRIPAKGQAYKAFFPSR
jgi:hypothetical protein